MADNGYSKMGNFSAGDIFVCGWPKSGNTWCQRLMAGMCYGVGTDALTDQLAQVLCPDVHFRSYYQRISPCMTWKSHFLPQPEYRRVIHLVRDGRDALVSYWHMRRRIEPDLTMEHMFALGDDLWPCSWERHCHEWLRNTYNADIIRVRYEDLQSKPLVEMRKLANFIGSNISENKLLEIYSGASFKNMKRVENTTGWAHLEGRSNVNLVRRGEAGAWRDEMPPSLAKLYWERAGAALAELGYTHD